MSLIFCIGLPKTGTSSLTEALNRLGYSCFHNSAKLEQVISRNCKAGYDPLWGVKILYDAFADYPNDVNFKVLDVTYPGSLFICTERSIDSWLTSRENHSKIYHKEFNAISDTILYNSHYKEVKEYFSARENDILYMNIFEGDGWDKLCSFLHKPIPSGKFPWCHKTIDIKA